MRAVLPSAAALADIAPPVPLLPVMPASPLPTALAEMLARIEADPLNLLGLPYDPDDPDPDPPPGSGAPEPWHGDAAGVAPAVSLGAPSSASGAALAATAAIALLAAGVLWMSTITLFDGCLIAESDGLRAAASRAL
jgi:hypothetical protein